MAEIIQFPSGKRNKEYEDFSIDNIMPSEEFVEYTRQLIYNEAKTVEDLMFVYNSCVGAYLDYCIGLKSTEVDKDTAVKQGIDLTIALLDGSKQILLKQKESHNK